MSSSSITPNRSERLARGLILIALFLLPLFFIPSVVVPFQFSKTVLALVASVAALIFFSVSCIRSGRLALPRERLLFAAPWLLAVAAFLSALFSSNIVESLIGRQLLPDTFGFLALGALLMSLIALLFRSSRSQLLPFGALVLSALLLGVFELVHVLFGTEFTSVNGFSDISSNPLGKWNDLAVFFGSIPVLSLLVLAGFPRRQRMFSVFIYVMLAMSLAVLAIVNFVTAWLIVGGFALCFSIYFLYQNRMRTLSGEGEQAVRLPFSTALFVLVFCGVFFFSPLGDWLSIQLGTSHIEARPSWESSSVVLQETYRENLLFGSGPNTFAEQWSLYKPRGVNGTLFWDTDFASGVSSVVTSTTTGGLVTALAWLVLLGSFVFTGARALVGRSAREAAVQSSPAVRFSRTLTAISFFLALYFWLFAIFYVPGGVVLLLAFAFTGLFIATLQGAREGATERHIDFVQAPRVGFVAVLILVIVCVAGVTGVYSTGVRYVAAYQFQTAAVAEREEGPAAALSRMEKVNSLVTHDQYLRYSGVLYRSQLEALVAGTPNPTTADQERFRELLSNAVNSLLSARRYAPGQYQNWLELGRTYALITPLEIQGAYDSAVSAFDEAVARNPHGPQIPLERARLEASLGNGEAAREFITQALQKKNNYAAPAFLLARLEVNEGDIAGAIESAEAATVLAPEDPTGYFLLGVLYYEAERFSEASGALQRAVILDNQYANAWFFLGLALYESGATTEAIKVFEQLQRLQPDVAAVDTALSNLRSGQAPLPPAAAPDLEEETSLPISE